MHRYLVVAAVSIALSAPAVLADEAHHPDQKGAPAKTTATKEAKAPAAKDAGMPMGMMQDNMLKMHEQMHKVMQAKDPKERERLKQEHMNMMQEQMKMMQGTMGHGMMGPGTMGGDGKGGMTDAPAGK